MRIRIDLKIFIFSIIFYFTNQIRIYFIIMFFSFLHEMGHIIMAFILNIKLEKIEIMVCGFSATFKEKLNNTKIKEILVTIAGPITSLALAILYNKINLEYISKQEAVYSNILIFLFNFIPIYPLDGGRIIKIFLNMKFGVIKSEKIISKISNVTIIIITIICSIAVYYYKNLAIFIICIFLWYIALKEKNSKTLAILQGK